MINPLTIGRHALYLDDDVDYMSVKAVGDDLLVSFATYEAVGGYGDAGYVFWGLLSRGLPDGVHLLPLDGPFGDAARLDGRYRDLVAARNSGTRVATSEA